MTSQIKRTMQVNARALRICNMRKRGLSIGQIASNLGLSRQYVYMMLSRGQGVEQEILAKNPAAELCARVRNALTADDCDPSQPANVRAHYASLAQLKRVSNIGVKCIKEINNWLRKHGQEPIK